jgi:hypothetical protein
MSKILMCLRFLVCLIFVVPLHAQFLTLSGRVSDQTMGETLPYASVAVKHSTLGTIANAEGAFTIHLPIKHVRDTLSVSMIGYETYQIIIGEVSDAKSFQVWLKRAPSILPEVIVRDTLTPLAILQRAHDRVKDNYINTPFIVDGFYRELQKHNGTYVSLVEAAASLHSDGYRKGKKETLKLNQLRRSKGYENPYILFWERKNLLLHFVGQNYVRYNAGKHLEDLRITRLDDTSIDGRSVYVLQVDEPKRSLWPALLYIRCDNYAVIRAEERYDHTREGERPWKVESVPFITSYPQEKILQVDYAEHNGKYYARNYRMVLHTFYKNSMNDELLMDFSILQQFVVTNLVTQGVDNFPPREILRESVSLKKMPIPYDPAFWAHYNIAPLDTAVRRDLERQKPLEDQFRMP